MSEFNQKISAIRQLMEKRKLQAIYLRRNSSFAWATCGAHSYINTAATDGVAALLVTEQDQYLITNTIEAPRLEKEEKLVEQGWKFQVSPWHAASMLVEQLSQGMKLGADLPFPGAEDVAGEISRLRVNLLPIEVERVRTLGGLCAEAMDKTIRAVKPGQSENEIAARLAFEAQSRGAQPIVNLIATDERIFNYRHPLPTSKKMERYAMLVLCGRRQGLVCSITRLVYFGTLPADLRKKSEAVAQIDATFISATRPGVKLNEVFQRAVAAYASSGFADEWRLHHQGGPAGYEPRECVATPEVTDTVAVGQVYAWNPSITGTKSEDSVLVGEKNNEVLTVIPGWPVLAAEVAGQVIPRPAILEIK